MLPSQTGRPDRPSPFAANDVIVARRVLDPNRADIGRHLAGAR
jgi:hypothetical protein